MNTVIDERVVEMRFNNEDFEKNVAQSMATLDDLKKSLNFDSAKSLEEIGKASKNFSLSGVTETITKATTSFSALEIAGVTAISKITSAAMDMGVKIVKSMSIDQVTKGFDRYAQKTSAVQTIMAATAKDFADTRVQMQYVNDELETLAWFTDETSYSFTDMVSSIGKFTSNNVKLDDAATAMRGIANWAAVSGANITDANRAMYNMAQSIGSGAVKLIDWKSIENANMATYEFKQNAAETAVTLGTLKKVGEDTYETLGGNVFTLAQFNQELKDGWFNSEVLISTLKKYGGATEILHELYEMTGLTTSEVLDLADSFKKGTLDISELANETRQSADKLTELFDKLSSSENELGVKAFRAAQEAKTFREAMDATAEAVSSKWMQTFELIFGNYEEAKKLWTGVANGLYVLFATGGDWRNDTLREWKERNALIEAFVNILNIAIGPINAVKEAWYSMFPKFAKDRAAVLDKMTTAFRDFTKTLVPSEKLLTGVYSTFKGLFSAGKMVAQVFGAIVKAILPATKPFGSLLEMFFTFTGYIGAFITAVSDYAQSAGVFSAITNTLSNVFKTLINILKMLGIVIGGGLITGINKLISGISKLVTATRNFVKNSGTIQKSIATIISGFESIRNLIRGFFTPAEKITEITVNNEKHFADAAKAGQKYGVAIRTVGTESTKAATPLQKLVNFLKKVGSTLVTAGAVIGAGLVTIISNIGEHLSGLRQKFIDANKDSTSLLDYMRSVFTVIGGIFVDLTDKIQEFFSNHGIDVSQFTDAFDKIKDKVSDLLAVITPARIAAVLLSVGLLALVGAVVKLTSQLGGLVSAASGLFTNLNKILKKQFAKSSVVTDVAKAIAIVAASLALLSMVDQDSLKSAAITLGVFAGAFALFTGAITVFIAKSSMSKKAMENFQKITNGVIKLAGSVAVLAAAMGILAAIDVTNAPEMWEKIVMTITLLGSVAAIAWALGKNVTAFPKGTILILAMAGAMNLLVGAIKKMASITVVDTTDKLILLAEVISAFIVITGIAQKLPLTSAIGLVLVAKSIDIIMDALSKIAAKVTSSLESGTLAKAKAAIQELPIWVKVAAVAVGTVISVVSIIEAARSVTKIRITLFDGIAGAIAALGVSIYLVSKAVEKLMAVVQATTWRDMVQIVGTITGIVASISLFFMVIRRLNKVNEKEVPVKFASLAVAILAVGTSVYLIAKGLEIISNAKLVTNEAIGALLAIGTVLAVSIFAASQVPKAMPAIAALVGATVAVGVLMGELALLSIMIREDNWTKFIPAFGTLTGVFIALKVTLSALGKIKAVKMGPLLVMVGSLTVLTSALYLLAKQGHWPDILAAGTSVSIVIGVLAGLIKSLSKVTTGAVKAGNTVKILLSFAVDLLAIGGAIAMVAQFDWHNIAAATGAIGLALGALVGLVVLFDKLKLKGTQEIATTMLELSGTLIVIAAAIRIVEGVNWSAVNQLVTALFSLGAVVGILALLSAAFPPFGEALGVVVGALYGAAGAFVVAAAAFDLFAAGTNLLAAAIERMTPALVELDNVGLLGIAGGLTALALSGVALGVAAIPLGVGAAAISVLALAFGALKKVIPDFEAAGDKIAKTFQTLSGSISTTAHNIGDKLSEAKASVSDFFTDIKKAFSGSGADAAVSAAEAFGNKLAGSKAKGTGLLGKFADALDWHSPPGVFQEDLMNDIGYAFDSGDKAVHQAEVLGHKLGDGLGKTAVETTQGWLEKLKNSFGDFMDGFPGISNLFGGSSNPITSMINSAKEATEKAMAEAKTAKDEIFCNMLNPEDFMSDMGIDGIVDKVTEATNGATESVTDFGDAESGASGKSKELSNTLKDQIDIFEAFNTKTDIAASTTLNNMRSNLEGMASWATKLAVLSERGIDQALYKKLAEMGPKGYAQVEAFIKMSSDELKEANRLYNKSISMTSQDAKAIAATYQAGVKVLKSKVTESFGEASEEAKLAAKRYAEIMKSEVTEELSDTKEVEAAAEELGEKVAGSMEQAMKKADLAATAQSMRLTIADLVRSQMDLFSEFETKTELTSAKLLENMKSNINGMTSWASNMSKLAEKGIEQGLLQQLVELGPKGYETVNAFVQMTDEQLKEANELYAQSLTLPEPLANQIADSFLYAGEMAIQGFSDVLGSSASIESVKAATTGITDAVKMVLEGELDIHSPSRYTGGIGTNTVLGLTNAIAAGYSRVALVVTTLVNIAKANLNGPALANYFYNAGMNAALGFANGIGNSSAAERVRAEAQKIANIAISTMRGALDEHSPSRVLEDVGSLGTDGFVIGIASGAENVRKAAGEVADAAIDAFDISSVSLKDMIDSAMDFNPVITPLLDLSVVRSQLAELDSLFTSQSVGINGQNGGSQIVQPQQNFSFTQINNSPKAINATEVYRQTRNQFAQLKGAVYGKRSYGD